MTTHSFEDDYFQSRLSRNVSLYRQRQKQLDDDLASGFLEQGDYDNLSEELARDLLTSAKHLQKAPIKNRLRWPLWLALAFLPIFSLWLYLDLGAYPDWKIKQALNDLGNSETAQQYKKRQQQLKELLQQRIEKRPENIRYRLWLGQLAMTEKNIEQAVVHYRVLAELLPEDAQAKAYYAQALYLQSGRKMTDEVLTLMQQALVLDPYNTTVLGLQGIHGFETEDYALAAKSWRQLLKALDPESEQAQLIAQGVKQAEDKMAEAGQKPSQSEGFTVALTLANSAKKAIGENAMVFVFAKAVNGPPMPLAAVKIPAKTIPEFIRLSVDDAMVEGASISDFDKVVVSAHLSINGQAKAKAGDFKASEQTVMWQALDKPVTLTIDTKVQ